jgi:hypothetical protein
MTELTDVDSTVDAILKPLRDTLARIDAEIAEHDAAIATLKQARAKPARILAAAERTPKAPGPKPGVKGTAVSPERLDQLTEWLQVNVNGEAFYASQLVEREDFDVLVSQSQVSKALIALADRGTIRLDSKGIGGRKMFKLVEAR